MTKAKVTKSSLTSEQIKFYKVKTISDTRKIKDWIGFLAGISILDQKEDQKRKVLLGLAILSLVAGFIFIMVSVKMDDPFLFIFTAVCFVISIFLFYARYQSKKHDISNYLRLFFLPILKVLVDKAGAEAKLAATLDFNGPRIGAPEKKKLLNGRKQSLYTPTYFLGRVQLLDKAKLQFGFQDEIKDQTWTKTNFRGKTKYKSKTKTIHHLLLKISIPKSGYSWNGVSYEDLVITEETDHYEAKKKVKLKRDGNHHLSVDYFFRAVSSIYQQFTPLDGNGEELQVPTKDKTHPEDDLGYMAPYMWHGSYFDDYDYDSVDYHDGSDLAYDQDENSVFDS